MTNTNHTPTPWRVGTESSAAEIPSVFIDHDAAPYTGMCLARVFGRQDRPEERHANAAHIVRCVNAHDELVAALRGVMRFALPITALDVDDFYRARAALAKVEA